MMDPFLLVVPSPLKNATKRSLHLSRGGGLSDSHEIIKNEVSYQPYPFNYNTNSR